MTTSKTGSTTTVAAILATVLVWSALTGNDASAEPASSLRATPVLPSFAPRLPPRGGILPPVSVARAQSIDGAAAGHRVRIDRIRFVGARALSQDELAAIASGYVGRALGFAEIEALRDAVTGAYLARGYVTSGAVLEPQSLIDRELTLSIIEGTLVDIEVATSDRFRPAYFEQRLEDLRGEVVRVGTLERRVQRLQADDRVRRIDAEIVPAERRGEARLRLEVAEAEPRRVSLSAANDVPRAIGGEALRARFAHRNLLGLGDRFTIGATSASGLKEIEADYAIPINRHDTRLAFGFRQNRSAVVDDEFEALDIEGRARRLEAGIHHPLMRGPGATLEVSATIEHAQSRSFLLGERFSFSPGPRDGLARVSVLRMGADWVHRGPDEVAALRTSVGFGLDAFGATRQPGDVPDGEFRTWRAQARWARRLPPHDITLIVRGELQLADAALLGLEQFVVGGQATVRGHRENERVRDNALVGSLELRVPLPVERLGAGTVELAPFVDAGNAWNRDRASSGPHTLVGAGVGLRWQYRDLASARLYWGKALREVERSGRRDLQDRGIHFALEVGGW